MFTTNPATVRLARLMKHAKRTHLTHPDHFHVHIVNANYHGSMGMAVGQAHLLDDIISLVSPASITHPPVPKLLTGRFNVQLELDPDEGPGIFERMTITYGLGDQHTLYEPMRRALNEIS